MIINCGSFCFLPVSCRLSKTPTKGRRGYTDFQSRGGKGHLRKPLDQDLPMQRFRLHAPQGGSQASRVSSPASWVSSPADAGEDEEGGGGHPLSQGKRSAPAGAPAALEAASRWLRTPPRLQPPWLLPASASLPPPRSADITRNEASHAAQWLAMTSMKFHKKNPIQRLHRLGSLR